MFEIRLREMFTVYFFFFLNFIYTFTNTVYFRILCPTCMVFGHHLRFKPFVPSLNTPQPELSGASTKQARKHLLQQLSVSLWTNNARMILRYWALQCEDSDFPFPKPLL